MKACNKILIFTTTFYLVYFTAYSKNDSLVKSNKKQFFISATIGAPVYNKFGHKNSISQSKSVNASSKSKIAAGLNFDFNFNHFTLNILSNYCQNEFDGSAYNIIVAQLNSGSHQIPIYKYYEIYQRIRYDYVQAGIGFGYNKGYKKNHFSVSVNFLHNFYTDAHVSSYYSPGSALNDRDTVNFKLVKNHKSKDITTSFSIYGNLNFSYSYRINKKFMACASVISSYGWLDVFSSSGSPSYDNSDFAYYLRSQISICPMIGMKYRLN